MQNMLIISYKNNKIGQQGRAMFQILGDTIFV